MIATSFANGIRYIVENSPEQLVCVDTHKTIKFYDFKHESEKTKKEEEEKQFKLLEEEIYEEFKKADEDEGGSLEEDEATPVIHMILSKFSEPYKALDPEQQNAACEKLFDWMDVDKSGSVAYCEFKSSLERAWFGLLPAGIFDQPETENTE